MPDAVRAPAIKMSVNGLAAGLNVHFPACAGIGGAMNGWIVFAAIASIAITALLTWVLYRLNAATEPKRGSGDAGDAVVLAGDGDGGDGGGD